ncbi:hypothetical protein CEXT_377921 [Caerostris extrusa]|uniref:Uncharacterized protein n=1 Tax=Caerostris extrusa TaxID=172846 RepID=A0AAV4WXU7_CAEEX|nr:hypothetical protein CEXT_377921 [Caerostris extrusa]
MFLMRALCGDVETSIVFIDDERFWCKNSTIRFGDDSGGFLIPNQNRNGIKGFKCKPHYRWFSTRARDGRKTILRRELGETTDPVPGSNGVLFSAGRPTKEAARNQAELISVEMEPRLQLTVAPHERHLI